LSPGLTPSQTVGPFLSIGLPFEQGPFAVPEGTPGAIRISGRVLDGAGEVVPDALVETWQAGLELFARCPTDARGAWFVVTLPPEPVDGQAPHLAVSLFARGLLHRVVTRIYLAEHAAAHPDDPVLARVPAGRRGTLIAEPTRDGHRFDIRIQGPGETVFFDV
jgi:protocatechuate 3,4-dioxygenase, alpha subunit